MTLSPKQIEFRHGHHAPPHAAHGLIHRSARGTFIACANDVQGLIEDALAECPPGNVSDVQRALALMHTNLEQARMWAQAAIAYAGAR